jgi:glycosyltransferase involved in cell wall biosynthesis
MIEQRPKPEVTVVIPTRNRSRLLPIAVSAALAQEEVEVEVIVVDDASTDDTPKVLAELADERLRVVRLRERHGVASARNIGIAEARAGWLAFLDDDDIWAPRKLRWQLDAAHGHDDAFVYGAAVMIDENHAILRYGQPPEPVELQRALLVRNVIPGGCSNVIARTGLVKRVGGFDERLSHLADRDLWIRLAHSGHPVACPYVVVAYLLHAGNMRHQREPDGIEEVEYLLEKFRPVRRQYGLEARRKATYHYFARAQLSAGYRLKAASIFATLALKEHLPADLGRAVTSIILGRGRSDPRTGFKPRAARMPLAEIEWLRRRSAEELAWLHALTLARINSMPTRTETLEPVQRRADGARPMAEATERG